MTVNSVVGLCAMLIFTFYELDRWIRFSLKQRNQTNRSDSKEMKRKKTMNTKRKKMRNRQFSCVSMANLERFAHCMHLMEWSIDCYHVHTWLQVNRLNWIRRRRRQHKYPKKHTTHTPRRSEIMRAKARYKYLHHFCNRKPWSVCVLWSRLQLNFACSFIHYDDNCSLLSLMLAIAFHVSINHMHPHILLRTRN